MTDTHPLPYLLPVGMCFTSSGLVPLPVALSRPMLLLLSAALVGCGSSVFHPESSRQELTPYRGTSGAEWSQRHQA